MSSVRRLDLETPRAPRIIATAILTAVTVGFLLLSGRSARVSAPPPAAGASYQAAERQVPSDPPEAEETAAVQTPIELEPLALHQNPNDPPADEMPAAQLYPSPPANPSPRGSEQRLFKSRRALETVDAREFLRRTSP